MNLRKFYLIITAIVSLFLFVAGVGAIYYINSQYVSADASSDKNAMKGIFEPFMQSKEPFNILVLGGDKVNKNSDTMMLVNFDPSTLKVNIMSIPRDTKVKIDNRTEKINYAYPHAGIDLTAQTVSELLNVKIKYYVFVDTVAFKNIIDLLGGVQIDVPVAMDYDDPTQNLHIHLKPGLQTLNGEQAEGFVRFRHPNTNHWTKAVMQYYDGSDLKRIQAQQTFLKELIRQKLSIQYLPKLNSVLKEVFKDVDTNFTMSDLMNLTSFAGKFNMDNLNFIEMPGAPYDGSPWYYVCDVDKTREITAQSFMCSSSFVNVSEDAINSYSHQSISTSERSTSTTSSKKRTAKNNPSNADSSLKTPQEPAP